MDSIRASEAPDAGSIPAEATFKGSYQEFELNLLTPVSSRVKDIRLSIEFANYVLLFTLSLTYCIGTASKRK